MFLGFCVRSVLGMKDIFFSYCVSLSSVLRSRSSVENFGRIHAKGPTIKLVFGFGWFSVINAQ